MDFSLNNILETLLAQLWFIFSHGGWVVFVLLVVYILFQFYMYEIQSSYKNTIEWTFYEIKPSKENLSSFYNAEQIFIQLHQLFDKWNTQEKYLEGKVVFWLSLEIVSLGGKISYVLRVPTKQKDLVEAAFYANYPNIEMHEIEDYLANFHYDPDSPEYKMFGGEFILTEPQANPIRTYREFISLKGPDASEKVVDPLAPLLEVFSRVGPDEFYAFQIVIQPEADGALLKESEELVAKLAGEKDINTLDEITKLRIAAIKAKAGKPGFKSKIRILHMGKSESFNSDAKKLIISPMKVFSSIHFNNFRITFTPKMNYTISQTLEDPYINHWVRKRKLLIFNGFKQRSTWIGENMFTLNVEELATIFHFPVTAETTIPSVETVEMKKIQPPANLPI